MFFLCRFFMVCYDIFSLRRALGQLDIEYPAGAYGYNHSLVPDVRNPQMVIGILHNHREIAIEIGFRSRDYTILIVALGDARHEKLPFGIADDGAGDDYAFFSKCRNGNGAEKHKQQYMFCPVHACWVINVIKPRFCSSQK